MRLPVAIICALEGEAAAVRRALGAAGSQQDIPVVVVGPGAASLARVLDVSLARTLVVAGVGGGLNSSLGLGEVIVDSPPPGWVVLAGSRGGRITSADRIIATPGEKRALAEASGADVVDMETGRVRAHVDAETQVIGVRAVLDGATESLPPWLGQLVGETGKTSPLGLVKALARNPARIATLISLAHASSLANRAFARTTADLAFWLARQPGTG